MSDGNCSNCDQCGTDKCRKGKGLFYAARLKDGGWNLIPIKSCPTCKTPNVQLCGFRFEKIGGCGCHPILRASDSFYGVTVEEMRSYAAEMLSKKAVDDWTEASRQASEGKADFLGTIVGLGVLFFFMAIPIFNKQVSIENVLLRTMVVLLIVLSSIIIAGLSSNCFLRILQGRFERRRSGQPPSSNPEDYLDQVKFVIESCQF